MRMIMNDPEQSVLNFLSLSEFFDKDLFAFFSSLSFRFPAILVFLIAICVC